jgi:tetratricopeptide (TPR) repeat protein
MQDAVSIGVAHFAASLRHLLQGNWAEARAMTARWIAVCRAGNVVIMLPPALSSSAWVLAQLGETSDALDHLREGEQLIEREEMNQRGWTYHALGRASLLLGRLDEAQRLASRAVEFSPSHHGFAAQALCLLGDIATHPERFDAESGELHYRKALALAEPRGMRLLAAHCHLGLGKMFRRSGQSERASELLTTAATMYRAMGVPFWLAQAETGEARSS